MKQWIWGTLINIYTKITKWKADRDLITDSAGWQHVIRNRHDTLHACCKKIVPMFIKCFTGKRDQLEMRRGNSSQISLHHNYSFMLTILGENRSVKCTGWGKGAVCNCHPPSNLLSPGTKAPTRNICQRPTDTARLFHILFFSGKLCLSHDIP